MINPTVTIITPVGPVWSVDFLRAVKKSLYANVTDFEWIISCDGASFHDVARAVGSKRSALIRVIGGTENHGIARARNAALELARGTWVYAMDADDISLMGIDRLLEAAIASGTVYAAGKAYDVDVTGETVVYEPDDSLAPFTKVIPLNGFLDQADKTGVYPFLCSGATLIRTDVVRRFGGWDEGLRDVSEDVALLARVSAHYEGAWVSEPVLAYRKHVLSITAGVRSEEDQKAAWDSIRAGVKV
jgi:GT2 family glycosyltransferase